MKKREPSEGEQLIPVGPQTVALSDVSFDPATILHLVSDRHQALEECRDHLTQGHVTLIEGKPFTESRGWRNVAAGFAVSHAVKPEVLHWDGETLVLLVALTWNGLTHYGVGAGNLKETRQTKEGRTIPKFPSFQDLWAKTMTAAMRYAMTWMFGAGDDQKYREQLEHQRQAQEAETARLKAEIVTLAAGLAEEDQQKIRKTIRKMDNTELRKFLLDLKSELTPGEKEEASDATG